MDQPISRRTKNDKPCKKTTDIRSDRPNGNIHGVSPLLRNPLIEEMEQEVKDVINKIISEGSN